MDARLQRRVQRYGWDLAAPDYEPLWQAQLAPARAKLLGCAALAPGELVLDVACGTGLIAFPAAQEVGPGGHVLGTDISGEMIEAARRHAAASDVRNIRFDRMDAERLDLPEASFEVALCSLGLMYLPDPEQALSEMYRVLHPGGRISLAVWGARKHCGWASVLSIVDDEVESDVCPLFFRLGTGDTLAHACARAGFAQIEMHRIASILNYADGDEACRAAFAGGPVALAWSRFDDEVREHVCARYLDSIAEWRDGHAYRVPGEFVVVSAKR